MATLTSVASSYTEDGPRPTLWLRHVTPLHCRPDDPRFDECPPLAPRCVSPTHDDETNIKQRHQSKRAIDSKMQHEWREDLLPEERRADLQQRTDRFLGKPNSPSNHTNLSSDATTEKLSQLPPAIETPSARPAGEDPFDLQGYNRTQEYNSTPIQSILTPPGCQSENHPLILSRDHPLILSRDHPLIPSRDHPLIPSGVHRPQRYSSTQTSVLQTPPGCPISVATRPTHHDTLCSAQLHDDDNIIIPRPTPVGQSTDRGPTSIISRAPIQTTQWPRRFHQQRST